MNLDLDIRDAEVNAFLRTIQSDQLPFATMMAVNATARGFQGRERSHLRDIFEVRNAGFADRSIKVRRGEFATKDKPEATVRVDSPRGRSDIFGKFETETSKSPLLGRSIAIPTDAVPRTGGGAVVAAWRPARVLAGGSIRGAEGNVFRGKVRFRTIGKKKRKVRIAAFLIRKPDGRGTIFERDGPDLVALYQLVPRVSIEPELNFVTNARAEVAANWGPNFTRAFDRAIGIR